MANVSKATLVLSGDTGRLRRAMSSAQRTMRSAAGNIKRRARRMGQAVASAMAAAGGAMVAFAAKSTQMAARFEKNMVKVNTLVGLSRDRVQGMRDDVLALAAETGQSPTKLAKALFRLTSGGIRGAEALDALRKSAQAARIGMGNVDELARLATSSVQAFESQGADMNSVLNTIFGTIREGNVRVGRLQSAFGMLQTVAADAGVTMQDMGAFLAATSRTMGDTSKAARGLRQFLVRLQDPTGDMPEAFKEAGTSVAEFRAAIQQEGLPRALVDLARSAERNGVEFAKMVASTESLPAILTAARTSSEEFLEISDRMTNTQSEFSDAVDETSKTLSDQIGRLKSTGQAAMIAFGERFAPAVGKLVNKIRNNMPQITATIARVMADTIKAIRSVLSFVDGAVVEMGVGGAIGFLFMGAQGAAIGGIIGKVIAEKGAELKYLANQLGADFELTPTERAGAQISGLQNQLQRVQQLQRMVREGTRPVQLSGRLDRMGIDPTAGRESVIAALGEEATHLNNAINNASGRLVDLLTTDQTGADQQGVLGRMAEEAKLLEQRLRRIAQGGGISLGGGGGTGTGITGPSLFPMGSLAPLSALSRGMGGGGKGGLGIETPQVVPLDEILDFDTTGLEENSEQASSGVRTLISSLSSLSAQLGDTASKILNAATQIASSIAKILQSSMTFGSTGGIATLISGVISGFAGFFAHGGSIPAGQFGIVGESGPEPVAGPATVFPDQQSFAAAAGGGGGITIDASTFRPATRHMLAQDPAWQAALDESLDQNERKGGKMAEFSKRGGRK